MSNFKKCPKCELNYIRQDEQYCMICNPKTKGKLICDLEAVLDTKRQERLENYSLNLKAKNDFLNIRYNRKPL